MTDEEIEVIESLKEELNKPLELSENKVDTFILFNIENAKRILNLIEKQQKEREELKEKYSKKLIEFQKEREWYEKNYISKDKIKAKIEVMNTNIVNAKRFDCDYIGQCRFAKYVLQSLLEEKE